MKKVILLAAGLSFLAGIVAATGLVIPPDQPVCRLYGMIQVFAIIGGIIAAAYAGFTLATSHDLTDRNNAKLLLSGVVIGLMIVWLAPLVVQNLVGSSGICGW